jgi:diguanylate cyclase (GGDEF)-like protein
MTRNSIAVLYFEPDEACAQPLREALAAQVGDGLKLEHATDLARASELVTTRRFDAVLLGHGSGERGSELLVALRRALPQLPVVGIEPDDGGERRKHWQREGMHDCLPHPSHNGAGSNWEVLLVARALRYLVERQSLQLELERARSLGLHLAHHDTLTDLPNRQLFRTRLRQLIAQAKRHPRALGVLFLDLDRFKQINDTLGHRVGDILLQAVARRLQACVRETDTAARRGGDEFTIILDGVKRGQDVARVAKKVLSEIAKPFVIDGHDLFITASIGISLFPGDGSDVETLVRNSDIAMYRAKGRGGNNYQFFLPEMNDRALERMELEHSLHQAIERQQFVLHYQPQVDLTSGRIVSMEALVRWQHPDLGLIYPDEFIPLAEETGLIVPLGDWVLETACKQARAWQDRGLPPVALAVNFSARQFQFRRPVERIRQALAAADLAPHFLELELTESVVMKDPSFAIETLLKLRDMGIGISIDDFGTGHSSLAYLKRFPITKLKIDKVFIRTLLSDPKDAAITNAIISMAHNLQLKAVAEGVETMNQLDFLRGPRCDEVQGYLFSRPLPPDQAERLLEMWSMPSVDLN